MYSFMIEVPSTKHALYMYTANTPPPRTVHSHYPVQYTAITLPPVQYTAIIPIQYTATTPYSTQVSAQVNTIHITAHTPGGGGDRTARNQDQRICR